MDTTSKLVFYPSKNQAISKPIYSELYCCIFLLETGITCFSCHQISYL